VVAEYLGVGRKWGQVKKEPTSRRSARSRGVPQEEEKNHWEKTCSDQVTRRPRGKKKKPTKTVAVTKNRRSEKVCLGKSEKRPQR